MRIEDLEIPFMLEEIESKELSKIRGGGKESKLYDSPKQVVGGIYGGYFSCIYYADGTSKCRTGPNF